MGVVKEKYLIVNADDFGLDPQLNRGISQACRQGVVRSVSLVAGGAAFENAVTLLEGLPGLGVGVHLCLAGERPVSPASALTGLVDGEGWLPADYRRFLLALVAGQVKLPKVELELEAQIQKVLDRGIRPTHLDSHQYLYFVPPILRIVARLARKYKIAWLRYPSCPSSVRVSNVDGALKLLWLKAYGPSQSQAICLQGVGFPEHSYAVEAGGQLSRPRIETYLRHLGPGINDLTCHPGYRPETRRYDGWHYAWEQELAALTDPELGGLVDSLKIKLGNYAI